MLWKVGPSFASLAVQIDLSPSFSAVGWADGYQGESLEDSKLIGDVYGDLGAANRVGIVWIFFS